MTATFTLTYTPDGVTTIVTAECRPGPHRFEFLVATADEEAMNREAAEYCQAWLDKNGKAVFGHEMN